MATFFFIDRNEAMDALVEALEPSPEMLDTIRTTLRELPFTQAVEISAPTLLNAAEYIKNIASRKKDAVMAAASIKNTVMMAIVIKLAASFYLKIGTSNMKEKWRMLHENS